MKKFDWDHAVTRKDYAVLCGWLLGIVAVFYAIAAVITYWDEIKKWIKAKYVNFREKLPW